MSDVVTIRRHQIDECEWSIVYPSEFEESSTFQVEDPYALPTAAICSGVPVNPTIRL